MADKPSAMETMAVNVIGRLIGLKPDQLQAIVQGIGGGIQSAASDIKEIKERLVRIEERLAGLESGRWHESSPRNRLLPNGHDPDRPSDG